MIVDFINGGKKDIDELQNLLSNMIGYSIYHLDFEERHFKKYKYEDRLSHTDSHEAYRINVQKMVDAAEHIDADVMKIAQEAAQFAGEWLQQHILVVDKKYTEFFRSFPLEERDDYQLLM